MSFPLTTIRFYIHRDSLPQKKTIYFLCVRQGHIKRGEGGCGTSVIVNHCELQSTLGFATMGKAANLALATRNAVTDLF